MLTERIKINHRIFTYIILVLAIIVYALASHYDLLESLVEFSNRHEDLEIDELIAVSIFLVFSLTFYSLFQWRMVKRSESNLTKKNEELAKALSEIKQLRGIVPICASCKKIRDDKGFWQQVEVYVGSHTEAEFSHGLCPDCAKRLYPELWENYSKEGNKPG